MNTKLVIVFIVAIVMVIWTRRIFFTVMDGDVLWKKIASGVSFCFIATMFVLAILRVIKTSKSANSDKKEFCFQADFASE